MEKIITVIGCGNTNRNDDGVGPYMAQRLAAAIAESGLSGVQSFDAGTGGMEVMFKARGSSSLIIIDACINGGAAPGTVYKVPGDELRVEHDPGISLHDFRWQHALFAGRKIFGDDFPDDITVFLIEAGNIDLGLELSQTVKATADRLVNQWLDQWQRQHSGDSRLQIQFEAALRMVEETDADDREKAAMLAEVGAGLCQQARSASDISNAVTLFRAALPLSGADTLLAARIKVQLADALTLLPASDEVTLEEAQRLLQDAITNLQDEELADAHLKLGLVLQSLLPSGRVRPQPALQHYQAALRFFTPAAFPAEYAIIHNNMATLWLSLKQEPAKQKVYEAMAVQSFETALTHIDPEKHPAEYAMLQNNLGNALQYAASGHPLANNLRALEAYDCAISLREKQGDSVQLANTLANRANCLLNLPDEPDFPEKGNQQRLLKSLADAEQAKNLFSNFGDSEKAELMLELISDIQHQQQGRISYA